MKTPTLLTSRLTLAPQTAVHPRQIKWMNDERALRYSENRHRDHTASQCKHYVESFNHETDHIWLIHFEQEDEVIGSITAYRDTANEIADMGIVIDPEFWGKGFGSEAWGEVTNWLLREMCRKVEAGCMANNNGMIAVFKRTGFVKESERRLHFLWNGQPVHLLQFARFAGHQQ